MDQPPLSLAPVPPFNPAQEPELTVPDHLRAVLESLQKLEPLFHLADEGTTRPQFSALMAPHFWEVGASGNRYSREFVLQVLQERQAAPRGEVWRTQDYHITELGTDHYLLTYTLVQAARVTRRATIWRRFENGWQVVYHQGTVV
jgi:hypothetical protein